MDDNDQSKCKIKLTSINWHPSEEAADKYLAYVHYEATQPLDAEDIFFVQPVYVSSQDQKIADTILKANSLLCERLQEFCDTLLPQSSPLKDD